MTTALVLKIALPLSFLAALAAFYAAFCQPKPQRFNARQVQAIQSLRTTAPMHKEIY